MDVNASKGIDIRNNKKSLKQSTKVKRINVISPFSTDVQTDEIKPSQNGRPPTRHAFMSQTSNTKWPKSQWDFLFIADGANIRPMTARQLNLTFNDRNVVVPGDTMITTLQGDERDQKDKKKAKNKLIAGTLILIAILCTAAVITSVIILIKPDDKDKGNHKRIGMIDVIFAIDSLPGDYERSSSDIDRFCEEIQNGLDDALAALATSGHGGAAFHDVLGYNFSYYFDHAIRSQSQRSYQLVDVTELILNLHYFAPDGSIVPRDDAPDVVIVLSEGDSTVEAQNFIQRIEPLARVILVGTVNANWANLNQFNSNPNDRFNIDQADEILRVLRAI